MDRPDLVARLIAAQHRYDALVALGAKTEQQARTVATRYLTHASIEEITSALQHVERTKLKTYASVKASGIDGDPYAGILDTLHSAKITIADLDAWTTAIRRTTFASGNKFQPLPTHDEAWQTYSKIFTEQHPTKQTARMLLSTNPPDFSAADIRDAARLHWDLMPRQLRQRAWRLLPDDEQTAIRRRYPNNPDGAMQATADYYATPQKPVTP